jgi:hypothetical protein
MLECLADESIHDKHASNDHALTSRTMIHAKEIMHFPDDVFARKYHVPLRLDSCCCRKKFGIFLFGTVVCHPHPTHTRIYAEMRLHKIYNTCHKKTLVLL